jgi:CTP synthase (UTP-ammonia lyase)
MADIDTLYNLLFERRSISIKVEDTDTFKRVRNRLYKKQRLLTELVGKEYTLTSSFSAGVATFKLIPAQTRVKLEFEVIEDDTAVCSNLEADSSEGESNSALSSQFSQEDQESNSEGKMAT